MPDDAPAPETPATEPGQSDYHKSNAELWAEVTSELGAPADDDGDAEGEPKPAPKKPAKSVAKPEPADDDAPEETESDDDDPDDDEQKRRAAAKQVPREVHVEIRRMKREAREKLAADRERAMADVQQAARELNERYAKAIAVQQAIDSEDWDGLAKALGAEGWTDLNKSVAKKFASPDHKKVMELERWKREQEQREQQQAEERRQLEAAQRREQAQREYISALGSRLKESDDPVVAGLSADPDFARAVYQIQAKHYDPRTGELDITDDEAAAEVVKLARKRYNLLHQVFSGQPAPDGEQAEAPEGAARPRRDSRERKRKTIPRSEARETSSQRPLTDAELREQTIKDLMRADSVI